MKKLFIIFIPLILVSCNNYSSKKNNINTPIPTTFTLNGEVDFNTKTVYLNKIRNDSLFTLDSSAVINKKFIFKGNIKSPERFAITFNNLSGVVIVILEPKTFYITIKNNLFNNPKIIGSPLNTLLITYKNTAKGIFKKVDYLYPEFQKARLENDTKKLDEIKLKMETIENEFTKYSYNFIAHHSQSYVAAMLLADHLKASKIDTFKVKELFNLFPKNVQNSVDGKLVAKWIQLH
jgi:hypothetical protein